MSCVVWASKVKEVNQKVGLYSSIASWIAVDISLTGHG